MYDWRAGYVGVLNYFQILVRICIVEVASQLTPISTGHSGKHGHEFLEFEYSHGRLRYANNSNYRNDSLIRKESECAALSISPLSSSRRF